MIVDAADPRPADTVLDVACGGGLVVCAFAPHVKHATGIDMTPAMLERARQLATELAVDNVAWDHGDVGRLPYGDGTFGIVRWDEHFAPDAEDAAGQATCEGGEHLPLIGVLGSSIARVIQDFAKDGTKRDVMVNLRDVRTV